MAEAATLPLPREPGEERAGVRDLALLLQLEDGLDDADEVLRRLAAGERGEVLVERFAEPRSSKSGAFVVLTGRDERLLDPADPAIEDVAERPAWTDAVPSSVMTLRYTSSKRWKRRSLSETTTKLVAKPCA